VQQSDVYNRYLSQICWWRKLPAPPRARITGSSRKCTKLCFLLPPKKWNEGQNLNA
jgi:hypothetical protein